MTKLNSLARDRVIGPEGGAEDGAAGVGVGEGAAGVDVLVVSSSSSGSTERCCSLQDRGECHGWRNTRATMKKGIDAHF
jgi:hypothetical protein